MKVHFEQASGRFALGGIVAVFLLSLMVMLGWVADIPFLIQVVPGFVPMQFNTALGFFFLGLALSGLYFRRNGWALFGAGMTWILVAPTLLQYVTGLDWGIDQLFVTAQITDKTTHPGRMAPNTGICFLLVATSLWLSIRSGPRREWIYILLTSAAFSLALLAFTGYLLNVEPLFGWGNWTFMAVHTSIGFLLATTSLLLLFSQGSRNTLSGFPVWLPWFFLVFGMALSLSVLQVHHQTEKEGVRLKGQALLPVLEGQFVKEFRENLNPLLRMAERLRVLPNMSAEIWKTDAQQYLEQIPSIKGIYVIRLPDNVKPPVRFALEDPDIDFSIEAFLPDIKKAYDSTQFEKTSEFILTNTGNHLPGIVFLNPIDPNNSDPEVLVGYLHIHIITRIFDKLLNDSFFFQLWKGDLLLEKSESLPPDFTETTWSSRSFLFNNEEWRVEITPATPRLVRLSTSESIILGSGILISVLLALMIRIGLHALEAASQTKNILEENLSRLQRLIIKAPVPLMMYTANGEILQVSQSWIDATGYRLEQTASLPVWLDRTQARDREEKRKLSLARLPTLSGLIEFTSASGKTVIWDIRTDSLPSLADGTEVYVSIANDVTQLVTTREELQRSNRELDNFAYVASHDLKSPLRAIVNLSTWLAEDCADSLPDESKKDLSLLQDRVIRMEKLLDALLQYSRIGRKEETPETCAIKKILDSVVRSLDIPPGMRVEYPDDLPSLVAPEAALVRIFGNLIGNAIKHHESKNGTIRVSSEKLPESYEFCIADDGPGIAAEYHERVFGMFQTLKPRDEVEGSGMGLALVKKTVETHGGKIRIESDLGKGTRIFFTWPIQKVKKQERKNHA